MTPTHNVHSGGDRKREGFAIGRKALTAAMLAGAMAALAGCSCKDIGKFTGAGDVEFQAGSDGSCPASPGGTLAREVCAAALNQADAQARTKCKGLLVRKSDKVEEQACVAGNVHVYQKSKDLCGVTTTTTREYRCCDLPEGYEPVAEAPKPAGSGQ